MNGSSNNKIQNAVATGLGHPLLVQFLSFLVCAASLLLMLASSFMILTSDNNGLAGIIHLAIHIYAIVFSIVVLATEFSLQINSSQFGPRIVHMLPFLRARYGRALYYMTSGLIVFVVCMDDSFMVNFASQLIGFCGLLFGVMASMPSNPVDYRGFRRPNENDFISRM